MRPSVTHILIAAVFVSAPGTAQAARVDLSHWFFGATEFMNSNTATDMHKPDFLMGNSMRSMHCGATGVSLGGVWQLVKYDRKNHIALAAASTDQCSVALFKAPPPGVAVADGDLSQYHSGRGLHIGSSYQSVLSTYGKSSAKHSPHFVMAYVASIPGTTVALPHKTISLPEVITLVIDNDRVSSMTFDVDESGLF